MRGHASVPETHAAEPAQPGDVLAEVAASLREVTKELHALRRDLDARKDRGV